MNYFRTLIYALLTAFFALWVCTATAQDTSSLPFMNTKLSPGERAADLVHRMTLEEKASQLVNQARAIPRLGVPAYDWWSEALHGVARDGTTEIPEAVGLAARVDAAAIHVRARVICVRGRVEYVEGEGDGRSNISVGLDSGK